MNLIQIIIEKKLNGTVHFGPNPARPKSKIGDSSWRIGWRRRRWGRRPRSKLGGSESILGGLEGGWLTGKGASTAAHGRPKGTPVRDRSSGRWHRWWGHGPSWGDGGA
jgi:hypothetical protein